MIPKIIHYCWFGGKPLPSSAERCIRSWEKFCPDYEIRRWDEENFDLNECRYVREAWERKKWAFVSDYVRFAVLYRFGGIYFDTDVELIRGIDDIVKNGPFFALEPASPYEAVPKRRIAPGLGMGAEAGNQFLGKVLESYVSDRFVRRDGTLNPMTVNTRVGRLLRDEPVTQAGQYKMQGGFLLYPPEYFCPFNYYTGETKITGHTRGIHHYDAAWKNRDEKRIAGIRRHFAKKGSAGRTAAKVLVLPLRVKNRISEDGWINAGKRAGDAVSGYLQKKKRFQNNERPIYGETSCLAGSETGEREHKGQSGYVQQIPGIKERTEENERKHNGIELSIITPCFNRADTLGRLFASLKEQKTENFEWIVVDDGSEDGTKELIRTFQEERPAFPIQYLYEKNGGKHRAVNLGAAFARGEFIFIVDSDDALTPDALFHVSKWCGGIRNLPKIAGVAGRRITWDGRVVEGYDEKWSTGKESQVPEKRSGILEAKEPAEEEKSSDGFDGFITLPNNRRRYYHLAGDQAEIYKTSVLRKYPFPEFPGETFLSEDSVWNLLAGRGYVLRWYRRPIYLCEYREDGLSAEVRRDGLERKNFEGYSYRLAVNFRYAPTNSRKIRRLIRFYLEQTKKGYSLRKARARLAEFFRIMDRFPKKNSMSGREHVTGHIDE